MLDRLPIEIALAIFRQAAEIFVVSDRASAVSLAQTSQIVYATVRPVLLRRVIVTEENEAAVLDLLQRGDCATFILDLTFAAMVDPWNSAIMQYLAPLHCLRGDGYQIVKLISRLPRSSKLYKIQLWEQEQGLVVPLGVSHLCLRAAYVLVLDSKAFIPFLIANPSVTHFGIEYISYSDFNIAARLTPSMLIHNLRAIFQSGGSRLLNVSLRLGGHFVAPETWSSYFTALWREGEAGYEWISRVHLWRDSRHFGNWRDDLKISKDDAYAGVDVWSEACPLETFI